MDFGRKFVEDFFLAIDKNYPDRIQLEEFENYLTRCK